MSKENSSRKVSIEKFGTWFSVNATAEVIVAKCTKQIEICERWLVNLDAIKVEKEAEMKAKEMKWVKLSIQGMNPEEKEQIKSLLKESDAK